MNRDRKKISVRELVSQPELPSGTFLSWLEMTKNAQRSGHGAAVPCAECRACCTSSYFIHIRPDEVRTLARIPKGLVFAAPGLPKGNVLLGYDQNGHCPMFIDNKCSIYDDRPHTCRTYDCRVFAATGLEVGKDKAAISRPAISRQAHRWRFDFPTPEDHRHFAALQLAARFLSAQPELFPAGFVPNNPTQQAVLALKVYEVFLDHPDGVDKSGQPDQLQRIANAAVEASRKVDAGQDR